ncbi:MAG: substrate-binding domain-containing protein [Desulfobulbaceae bacterium]|nr:substrate-binding domain-containing protein [Desulfobulbaceae bacterium]
MGKHYPKIPAARSEDLHNLANAHRADLVLFMAGNQFMAMPQIIAAFEQKFPEVKNIFYETLPPGLELKQILAGGAYFQGKLLRIFPDIYSSVNEEAMKTLEKNQLIDAGDSFPYLGNKLTLMVPEGNPAKIESVTDLGRDDVRISQPDPQNEDIAHHIINMYRQIGGDEFVYKIMETKRAAGTTVLTTVHHRETPEKIQNKSVDVGPVWATEAIHARRSSELAFEVVEPGEFMDQRENVRYYISPLKKGGNRQNAEKFLQFIKSAEAQGIFERFGFVPASGNPDLP